MRNILDIIKEKTVEVGDCMEWTGYYNRRTPATTIAGRGISVRSLVALRLGMPTDGKMVTNRCCNINCVNPEHLVLMTKSQFHSHVSKHRLDQTSLSRRMKISKAVRKRSKLTAEIAAQIRSHPGKQSEIAEQFGVCKKTVYVIRAGITWRDYGMFAQLWTS
jgi:predicted XRE-type DNA-binding protein